MIIQLILLPIFAYVVLMTLYLLVLTVAAYAFRKKTGGKESAPAGPSSFLLVVPAHNEAAGIGRTIQDMEKLNYPADRFHTLVIADNCDDDTAQLAGDAGARVVERTNPAARGKGQALDWFFKENIPLYTNFDAVAIIDADTRPHGEFLTEMDASLRHPKVDVVQGFYGVSNPESSWRTALSAAALFVFHHIRPAGRNRLGGTAGLKGNGMAFKTKILEQYGWPAFSIVEDIEFSMNLLMNGIVVDYNPDAVVYGEMASGADQAKTQRARWEGGRVELLKTYTLPLVKCWAEQRRFFFFDALMELFIPPLSLLMSAQVLMLAFSMLFSRYLFDGALAASLLCLGVTLFYVLSGLILKKAPLYVWKSLLHAPFFILWKMPVYLKLLIKRGGGTTWERTGRESEKE